MREASESLAGGSRNSSPREALPWAVILFAIHFSSEPAFLFVGIEIDSADKFGFATGLSRSGGGNATADCFVFRNKNARPGQGGVSSPVEKPAIMSEIK